MDYYICIIKEVVSEWANFVGVIYAVLFVPRILNNLIINSPKFAKRSVNSQSFFINVFFLF